jgi:TfoX/Sxy family transcriptional regulator of competence genes
MARDVRTDVLTLENGGTAMTFDPELADRVRSLLEDAEGLAEKKMFGGIGWTIGGNMAAGAHNDGRLMIRCSKEDFEEFLAEPGAEAMKKGTRSLTGWVLIDSEAVADPEALSRWVGRGRNYAESLPLKK